MELNNKNSKNSKQIKEFKVNIYSIELNYQFRFLSNFHTEAKKWG